MRRKIIHERKILEQTGMYESVFSLANGKIGVRGFHDFLPETWVEDAIYMNGFHDTEDYIYGEAAYGYAKKKQKMLALPNLLAKEILVDGVTLDVGTLDIEQSTRQLDLENGTVVAHYIFHLTESLTVEVAEERFVSYQDDAAIWQRTTIETSRPVHVVIQRGTVDKVTGAQEFDPRLGSLRKPTALHHQEHVTLATGYITTYQTDESKLNLATGLSVLGGTPVQDGAGQAFTTTAHAPFQFEELFMYSDAITRIDAFTAKMTEVAVFGYEAALDAQKQILKQFWQQQNIAVDQPEISLALQLNVFHLFQHVGKDGKANICAKGLSGEGYEGHYFWDTEVYVLPFFIYTMPEIARQLLISRFNMLDAARARAKELSFAGAWYAWRTINGEEASAYYPAGTAQIHINADIAYAIEQYYNATLDETFMLEYGDEMLLEIARFFASYADKIAGKGWCINGVTGPDEYHTMTNNNAYTNLMVARQFRFVLSRPIELTASERMLWEDISEHLYIKKEGLLTAQDDAFFERQPWDYARNTKRPLLLHYHPMVIYKHQVLKQADLVLAMITCHEAFTPEEVAANYAYYEPLTTHDSSLSETMHGIVAAQIGKTEEAYQYLKATVTTDMLNTHGNTADGIHIAAMAGGWQSLVYGFAGLRISGGKVTFTPRISAEMRSYQFTIQFRGVRITLIVRNGVTEIQTSRIPTNFEIILR